MSGFDGIVLRAKGIAAERLLAAALYLQAEHKADLGRSNPAPHKTPAPKGEYPRGRTWNLRDAVVVSPASLSAVRKSQAVAVGVLTGAKYGYFLWRKGWRGIPDTLVRVRKRVRELLAGG